MLISKRHFQGPSTMSDAEAAQAQLVKRVLTAVTLVSLPVAASMPSSVLIFWVSNNTLSLLYTGAMLSTPVRSAIGLPPRPAPIARGC